MTSAPVALTAEADRFPGQPSARRSPKAVAGALIALTKPRIIELLLVTTVPTMLLAQRGLPSLKLVLVTLAGGTFAAGSAHGQLLHRPRHRCGDEAHQPPPPGQQAGRDQAG